MSDWILAVCENAASFTVFRRLRDVLQLPASAMGDLRKRLPGVLKRGHREELYPLYLSLENTGLRVSLFPAWQLDPEPSEATPDIIEPGEYAVYSAICRTDLFRFETPSTFADVTKNIPFTNVEGRGPDHPAMLEDYQRQNASGVRLRKKFTSPGGYDFMSERRQLDLCCNEGGVFTLTRAGFDPARRLALVGISYFGGPLCGVGYCLLFEQDKGEWKKMDRYTIWVS